MRKAGVLMNISSLPNNRGIGSFGREAYDFVDFLSQSGLRYWQVLPLCPTSYGDSPYQSPSAFAGNPYFVDIDTLIREGLLEEKDAPVYEMGYVNYEKVYYERYDTLRRAFVGFMQIIGRAQDVKKKYEEFKSLNASWLDDYAYFMCIKEMHDMQAWEHWADEYKFRTCDFKALDSRAEFWKFIQFKFFEQWKRLRAYANSKGVEIIGDMPIYVAYDSVEVWARPELFLLTKDMYPEVVAGVPPDMFSATGQMWGNPIYNWQLMREQGYSWWITRIKMAMELYDVVRIDHFRGFEGYFCIPYGREDAVIGEWRRGPGIGLFDVINRALDNPRIIAEDLGLLDDGVRDMVRRSGYPSMKVLQFGLYGDPKNDYYYKNYPTNCIAYTGTHDNDTTRGWFKKQTAEEKETVKRMLEYNGTNITWRMLECLFCSAADTVVAPMQDFLNLDTYARMNIPSTLGGNWEWRSMPEWEKLAPKIRKLVEKNGRL